MPLVKITLLIIILTSLLACTARPPAFAKFSGYYDFSQVSSYAIFDRNSRYADYQNISDSTRNSIELAIEQTLDAFGFAYRSDDHADVLVSYHLIEHMAELKKYNQGVQYCRPCLSEHNTSQDKPKLPMLPGSLVLDVINKANQRSIWRSVYPLKIKPDDNSIEVQAKLRAVIKTMLSEFPKHNA